MILRCSVRPSNRRTKRHWLLKSLRCSLRQSIQPTSPRCLVQPSIQPKMLHWQLMNLHCFLRPLKLPTLHLPPKNLRYLVQQSIQPKSLRCLQQQSIQPKMLH